MHYFQSLFFGFILLFNCNSSESKLSNQPDDTVAIPLKYKADLIVDKLEQPWGMTFLPDGAMLITEKKGEIIHFKNGKKTTITGVPKTILQGQGGLMDIQLDPNYAKNGWIYFSYASDMENDGLGANTTIARAKLANFALTNLHVLYKATPNTKKGQHFGSRIAFDKNGYLYFSIGDRGNHDENPQDITKDGGKIYRINTDGTIPTSNPFYNTPGAKKAIFSYGNRNPQGMILNPVTGEIWAHEHGPQGGDEINIIKAGKNYGWPKASYGINYNGSILTKNKTLPGMENPIHYWVPSIAPSGMAYVTSAKYPEWKGNVLVGSLKFMYLNRIVLAKNKVVKEEKLMENIGRVRTVIQAPDGFIYVAVEFKGIYRITPTT